MHPSQFGGLGTEKLRRGESFQTRELGMLRIVVNHLGRKPCPICWRKFLRNFY